MTWYAWLFIKGKWQCVGQADGMEKCMRLLGKERERHGIHATQRGALTSGGVPSWTPRPPEPTARPSLVELDRLT